MFRTILFVVGLALIVASVALVSYVAAGCLAGVFCCLVAYLDQRAHAMRGKS